MRVYTLSGRELFVLELLPNFSSLPSGGSWADQILKVMSFSQWHVAEKLDLLDPASTWRKDMRTVVGKCTELLPEIRDLLCSLGDTAAHRELPEKFPMFSAALEEVILQLQTSLVELRQRKAEWESALKSRTGDIARLDRQVRDLLEETSKATRELERLQHQNEQERQALEPLQLQVKQAEAELHRGQEEDASIRHSQMDETRRLQELEIRLQNQEQYLIQREVELTEWSQKCEDYLRAKDGEIEKLTQNILQTKSEAGNEITSLQESLQERSRELENFQSRFIQLEASHNRCVGTNAEIESLRNERNIVQFAAETDRVLFQSDLDSQKQIVAHKNDEIKRIESEKEKEISQFRTILDELREAYLGQANNYTVMEKDLSAKDKAVETLQHQLRHAQAEIERFKRAHVGEHTPNLGNGHDTEAQQDQRRLGLRNFRADGMAADSGAGQQISGSRKRKAGDPAPDSMTGEQHPGVGSRRGNDSTLGLRTDQQNASTRNLSIWTIENLRDPTYVPDPPLPAAVLSRLRVRFQDWDRRKIDWTKVKTGRRCVETVTTKKGCIWPHGEAFQCEYCRKHKELCVVVEKGDKLTLLPTYQGG